MTRTFDQFCGDLLDQGFILDSNICPDTNQVIYYKMKKVEDGQVYKIQSMISTTSLMNLQDNLIFEILKQHIGDMARELKELIFRDKNVFYRRVYIEKFKPTL